MTSPSERQTLAPGDTISITITALPGEDLANALIFSPSLEDNGVYEETFPATVAFDIPSVFAGSFDVMAMTRNSSGALAEPLELSFLVVPNATLTAITVVPDPVTLQTPGHYTILSVTGHYTDGVDRNITRASAGTLYSTGNPSIVTVTANGKVVVVDDGQTAITVQNSGVVANVPVDVDHARFLKGKP